MLLVQMNWNIASQKMAPRNTLMRFVIENQNDSVV